MNSREIRRKFLDFFEKKWHKIAPSSSLIPDDSFVLLTTAGMQQFVPYFLGEESPHGNRVATIQKCFRTSDIEEVGDESHLTFFEMLGNFSFNNNYYKKEEIEWAYEFLTKEMNISADRMWFSVFEGDKAVPFDQESYDVLKNLGFSGGKIKKLGRKDNFWGPTGAEGPCGPTVEFYIDDLEVWNLVFNEYFCSKDGSLRPLEQKGVDTGMGLERLAKITQRVDTVYDTDLFEPIIREIKNQKSKIKITNKNSKISDEIRSMRIIADHIRGSVFLIGDGVLPSNIERGYILRRLLRRAIRYAKLLELPENWHKEIAKIIVENYKEYYPELERKENEIIKVINEENEKFGKGLKGIEILSKKMLVGDYSPGKRIKNIPDLSPIDGFPGFIPFCITGKWLFDFYQTFGFPLELSLEELQNNGKRFTDYELNEIKKEFYQEIENHKEKSRAGLEKKFGGHGLVLDTGELKAGSVDDIIRVAKLHTATHLLHQALREILGGSVKQMGSDITPERLRFDFTYDKKVTSEQIKKIEDLVNEKIKENLEVEMREMPYKKAVESGALAFFKGKYPEIVKVYSIGAFSKEVCGGPHVQRTGELRYFKIKKEESSSAGVRRIRAVLE